MNHYELNVYDDEFEIVKTLEAPGIKWGKLVDIYEKATSPEENESEIAMLESVMQMIFPSATSEDLKNCLFEDMASILKQVIVMGNANGLATKTGAGKAGKSKN